ncbi:UNVERIFIED_CONTAM: hypothetical protein Sradi_4933300 [Sesamum radiatum]|uniref:Uncharacterized protein n=1 Tax=Sesamum radiatum TaxID=300843 RepID=A0AAW2MG11_SESRA
MVTHSNGNVDREVNIVTAKWVHHMLMMFPNALKASTQSLPSLESALGGASTSQNLSVDLIRLTLSTIMPKASYVGPSSAIFLSFIESPSPSSITPPLDVRRYISPSDTLTVRMHGADHMPNTIKSYESILIFRSSRSRIPSSARH